MKTSFEKTINQEAIGDKELVQALYSHYQICLGKSDEYLNDYFGTDELESIPIGESVIFNAPVGCGKTTAIINALKYSRNTCNAVILTNRKASKIQIKRAEIQGIRVMTYWELAHSKGLYPFKKGTILIMDEIHYLTNDATFSNDVMRIAEIIKTNKGNTIRIYCSATMDDVIGTICHLEYINNIHITTEYNSITKEQTSIRIPEMSIAKVYDMKSSWNHLDIKFYKFSDINKLSDILNEATSDESKTLVFTRSISRGNQFADKLSDNKFVYASSNDDELLSDIAINECFESSSLIATKVLENGVSITDDDIKNIVIEEPDLVTFMQFLGRVRTKRKNPRQLTLYIPDFTLNELKHFKAQCELKLNIIREVINDPEYCMRNYNNYKQFVYYGGNGPQANLIAYKKFILMNDYFSELIEQEKEKPHSFINASPTSIQQILHYRTFYQQFQAHHSILFVLTELIPPQEARKTVPSTVQATDCATFSPFFRYRLEKDE